MRCVLQRVSQAQVEVGGVVVGRIGLGWLALVGAEKGDTEADADWMADKVPSASTRERWMRTPAMRSPVVVSGVFGRQTSRPVMKVAAGASTLRVTTPAVTDMHDGALRSKS